MDATRELDRIPQWAWLTAFLAYVIAAALGLALAFPGTNASPFWPPTALALALLHRFGLRLWPVVLAGAFTINVLFMLRAGVAFDPALAASVGVGIGNMLEAVVGVSLLRRFSGDRFPFDHLRGLFVFLLACCMGPLVSATIGVTCSRMVSMSGAASYVQNWLTWWVGDSSGALTMGPILMLLLKARRRLPRPSRLLEAGVLAMTLVLGTMAAFGIWQGQVEHRYPWVFLLLPLVVWAVLRFQNAGAANAIFVISTTAVISVLGGGGLFASADVDESLILLQSFIIVVACTTLALGTVLAERGRIASRLKRSNAALNELAFCDALTGLPNRRALLDRVAQAGRLARRHRKHAAVLFLDLDHFKQINDSLGHAAGDELLRTIAQRLRDTLRDEDSVCRWGGDEFVLLLCDIDACTDAAVVARKAIEAIQAPVRMGNHDLAITTSIGIAMIPDDGTDGDHVLRRADQAMYRAKQRGRNNFQFHAQGMNLLAGNIWNTITAAEATGAWAPGAGRGQS